MIIKTQFDVTAAVLAELQRADEPADAKLPKPPPIIGKATGDRPTQSVLQHKG